MKAVVSFFRGACLAAGFSMAAGLAQAAEFPEKPVRVMVPFPAGGAADNAMRVVGKKLSEYWKQQVLIENSAGVQAIKAGAMAGKCVEEVKCAKTNEKCKTSADCCPPGPGEVQNQCLGGFCGFIVLE